MAHKGEMRLNWRVGVGSYALAMRSFMIRCKSSSVQCRRTTICESRWESTRQLFAERAIKSVLNSARACSLALKSIIRSYM